MAENHGRIGLCSAVTLSNEKAPSPIRAWPHPPRPAPLRGGRSRPTHGRLPIPFPAGLAGIPLPRPHDRLRSFTLT
jgi:hypothetical protein